MGFLPSSGRDQRVIRGVVLAGGRSRRFGSDKALAVYQGESFISRAFKLLDSLRLSPVVVTRGDVSYPFPEDTLLYDYLPEKGPLGGIYTAMRKFPEDDFLVLTCDMPALNEALLVPLIEEHRKKPGAVFYGLEDVQIEPFPALYPRELFSKIYKNIYEDKLAMRDLIQSIEKKIIPLRGPSRELVNINRVSDLGVL